MRYLELKEHFKDFVLFSLKDIKKIDPTFHRRRLSEWKEESLATVPSFSPQQK